MKARTFAPRKLDIGAFIESGEPMTGAAPVAELSRLAEGLAKDVDLTTLPAIDWSAQGRLVTQRVGAPQMWLDLTASGHLAWECQRCLHAVTLPISVERSIRFLKDEAAAAEMDADSDDDVLALSRQFDLMDLIEDELIMAQPIVPRHETCPGDVARLMRSDVEVPVPGQPAEQGAQGEQEGQTTASGRPNPFAVLASLKKDKS
ncbi:MAG: YceD family protein [Aquabacterium sp.]